MNKSPEKSLYAVAYSEPQRRSAVTELCRDHHGDLIALAARILPLQSAKDVVGEVYKDLLGLNIDTFGNIKDLPQYAKTMTRYEAYRTLTHDRNRRTIPLITDLDSVQGHEVLHKVRNWDLNMDIETFLQHLQPAEYAKIIRLYYLQGYPHRDIMVEMDLPSVGASKTKLSRACKKFLELYLRFNPDDDPGGTGKKRANGSGGTTAEGEEPAGGGYGATCCLTGQPDLAPPFYAHLNQLFMDHLAINPSAFPASYQEGSNGSDEKEHMGIVDILQLLIGETHYAAERRLRNAILEDPEQVDVIDGYTHLLNTLGTAEKVLAFVQADITETLRKIEEFTTPTESIAGYPGEGESVRSGKLIALRAPGMNVRSGHPDSAGQGWGLRRSDDRELADPPGSYDFSLAVLQESVLTGIYPWKFEVHIYAGNREGETPPLAAFLPPAERLKLPVPMLSAFDADTRLHDRVRLALAREILQGELELWTGDRQPLPYLHIPPDPNALPPTLLQKYLSSHFLQACSAPGERVFEMTFDPDHPENEGRLERIVLKIQWHHLQHATAETLLRSVAEAWQPDLTQERPDSAYIRWEAAGVFTLCHRWETSPFANLDATVAGEPPTGSSKNKIADIPLMRLQLNEQVFRRKVMQVSLQLCSRLQVRDLTCPEAEPQTFLLLQPNREKEESVEQPCFRLEFLSDQQHC